MCEGGPRGWALVGNKPRVGAPEKSEELDLQVAGPPHVPA